MVSNEIFVGSGVIASYAPESKIFLGDNCTVSDADNSIITIDTDYTGGTRQSLRLVPNLYTGCNIEIIDTDATTNTVMTTVVSNTDTTLTVAENVFTTTGTSCTVTIQEFGAPVPVFAPTGSKTSILSDNWLGLVNTFTPPNVEVETGELNLVAGGSRNLGFQFTKGETVSGGSIEVSMNNPMWLYYTLGNISVSSVAGTGTLTTSGGTNEIAVDVTKGIVRNIVPSGSTGAEGYPDPSPVGNQVDGTEFTDNFSKINTTAASNHFEYLITEDNSGTLPSFALDVSYSKGANRASGGDFSVQTAPSSSTPEEQVYSRIFTGCQVNSLNMQFDEGQEVKNSVEIVTRSAFDAPQNYAPHRQVVDITSYSNYSENKIPYLFHDGTIEIYGQNFARVKSGSLTINNNIVGQRFVGNYNNQIMSNHTAGQRQYELSLTLLITDTKIWDLLREGGESSHGAGGSDNILTLKFQRTSEDFVQIQFKDYITRSVSVPYPDDKGPVEVEVTISPRTLHNCNSNSRWAVYHLND